MDNFPYFSIKNVLTSHLDRLYKMVLMKAHNVCFNLEGGGQVV